MRIECSKCGELVDFTGDTVTAPFVCSQCSGVVWSHPLDVSPTADSTLSEDTATAEATVELVKDLTQQLVNERTRFEDSERVVKHLETLLKSLAREADRISAENSVGRQLVVNLVSELSESCLKENEANQWEMRSHKGFAQAMEKIDELQEELSRNGHQIALSQMANDNLRNLILGHERRNYSLEENLKRAQACTEFHIASEKRYYQRWTAVRDELETLKRKSPWYKRFYKYLTEFNGVWYAGPSTQA